MAGVVGWAPTSARQAITVTVFSYAGGVTIGFGTDRAVVPDADALIAALDEEWQDAARVLEPAGTDAGGPVACDPPREPRVAGSGDRR